MSWLALIQELEEWNRRGDALNPALHEPRRGPNAPADEKTILLLEAKLGLKLDEHHRSFLTHANGWSHFSSGTLSLLSTSEMLGSRMLDFGLRNIETISSVALGKYKKLRKSMFVIGASDCTLDVICMPVVNSQVQSEVVWFNNTEPDAFPSFDAYFRAIISYKPAVLEYFQNRRDGGATT